MVLRRLPQGPAQEAPPVRVDAAREQPEPVSRDGRTLGRHLLVRHGAVATLVEDRIVEQPPQLAIHVPSDRRRMFRSPRLEPAQIDYLYSELTCVAW